MAVSLSINAGVAELNLGSDENRLSLEWLDAVEAALAEVEAAAPVGLVTTADGKIFSNGLDLPWLVANLDRLSWYIGRVHALFIRFLILPVPTVAALNGHAFGAGAMIALAHDARVMRADRGFFCLPEVDIKIPFTPGMTALIKAKTTPQAASATMVTGARVPAPQAQALGIIDAIADEAAVVSTARDLVTPLVGKDPVSLGIIKQRMYAATVAALAETYVPQGDVPGIPGT